MVTVHEDLRLNNWHKACHKKVSKCQSRVILLMLSFSSCLCHVICNTLLCFPVCVLTTDSSPHNNITCRCHQLSCNEREREREREIALTGLLHGTGVSGKSPCVLLKGESRWAAIGCDLKDGSPLGESSTLGVVSSSALLEAIKTGAPDSL